MLDEVREDGKGAVCIPSGPCGRWDRDGETPGPGPGSCLSLFIYFILIYLLLIFLVNFFILLLL